MQAASLAPALGLEASLSVFTSSFDLPHDREQKVMHLDPLAADFPAQLEKLLGSAPEPAQLDNYKAMIEEGRGAGLPLEKATLRADDFFPEKNWEVLALTGYMGPDPYSGLPGVEKVSDDTYRVTVRLMSNRSDKRATFTLRLMKDWQSSQLLFSPLLNRFLGGIDYQTRPVKISDSGRIRNELQTLCAEALEYPGGTSLRLFFDRIPAAVIAPERQQRLLEVLRWYRKRHPIWFSWLELVPPGATVPEADLT
ncbi:unnamed protein product [Phaeothamnion confervicola]